MFLVCYIFECQLLTPYDLFCLWFIFISMIMNYNYLHRLVQLEMDRQYNMFMVLFSHMFYKEWFQLHCICARMDKMYEMEYCTKKGKQKDRM